jgi:uncharacterized protein YdeI (BOF family)
MHPAHVKSKETQMRIELEGGAVRLAPHQVLRLRDSTGTTVCAVEGAVWITEENQARDIVLAAGSCYRLRHDGLAIVNPLGGGAAVSFS